MVLDEALEERILAILRRNRARWRTYSEEAMRAGNRKQAIVPEGATILEPVGTAPGLIVPPATATGRWSSCCPGPPGGAAADVGDGGRRPSRCARLLARAGTLEQRMLRLFGVPESEIALTLRGDRGRRRRRSTSWRSRPACAAARSRSRPCSRRTPRPAYDAFVAGMRARHGDTLFSEDGATIDEQVARAARRAGRSRSRSRAPAG